MVSIQIRRPAITAVALIAVILSGVAVGRREFLRGRTMPASRTYLLICAISLAAICRAIVLPVTWSDEYHSTGPNNGVTSLIRWQGDVVAAGQFDAIGTVTTTSRVARLRDGVWDPLGDAITGDEVTAMVVHDDVLHAVVRNGSSYQVVRYDGDQWTNVGDPVPTASTAIASFQGCLHLGPYRLAGEVWIDELQTDDSVLSLEVMDDLLVAGGRFTSGAGIVTGHVMAWDGENVLNVFAGQDSTVTNLAVWDGRLYAARSAAGPQSVPAVQVWQDDAWVDIPELGQADPGRFITDLEPGDGCLLASGYWIGFLVKSNRSWFGAFASSWDGTTGETLSYEEGFIEYWEVLADGDDILVGGVFSTAGEPTCANLGRVIDGSVTPVCELGLGASGSVGTLQTTGNALVAGGSFSSIAGLFSRNVAVFESGTWSARDLGNGDEIGEYSGLNAVGWHDDVLYVVASGHTGSGAGYWYGGEWHMTTQTWDYPYCYELLSWGNMLLGSGRWNSVLRFSSLANPTTFAEVDGYVRDIMGLGANLIAGGNFDAVEGTPAANVAILDGGVWQPLAGGLPEQVRAVGTWQGHVVAATDRGGVNVVYLLDDDQWEELGTLAGGYATSVQEYAGLLFIGGSFLSPADDGTMMQGLACWTGSEWRSVGAVARVNSLAVHDEKLWVGGSFRFAGDVPAWNLTTLTVDDITVVVEPDLPVARPLLAGPAPNPFNPHTTISFNLPTATEVRLDVYDPRGRRVARLVDGHRAAGSHTVTWDGRDHQGHNLPSGMYLLCLEAGSLVATTKATLAR